MDLHRKVNIEAADLDQNKQVAIELIDAVNAADLDRLRRVLADDFVDHNKIMFGEADEPGGAFEALRTTLTAFAPFRIEIHDLVAEGDQVVARITQSGVNSGWHPRTPVPTGRSFENESVFILTVREGRIAEFRGVADRFGMLAQLGLLGDFAA